MRNGKIQIYSGDGKGKTTAAIGSAVRAAGAGLKVMIVFFDKLKTKGMVSSEINVLRKLKNIKVIVTGSARICKGAEFRLSVTDEDRKEARKAFETVKKALEKEKYDVIVLDEVLNAARSGTVERADLLELMRTQKKRPRFELIMTGRLKDRKIINEADLVTEMRNKKHYYEQGIKARKGIEF